MKICDRLYICRVTHTAFGLKLPPYPPIAFLLLSRRTRGHCLRVPHSRAHPQRPHVPGSSPFGESFARAEKLTTLIISIRDESCFLRKPRRLHIKSIKKGVIRMASVDNVKYLVNCMILTHSKQGSSVNVKRSRRRDILLHEVAKELGIQEFDIPEKGRDDE